MFLKNKTFILLFILLLIFVGIFYSIRNQNTAKTTPKISIYTSFYPLADFAQKIGGDKVIVTNLTPTGVEPHDFEPNPRDIADIYNSQIFIYNGVNLESWVDKILPELNNVGVYVVKASDNVEILDNDPHIWIDPNRAIRIVQNIQKALVSVDPSNQDYYSQNTDTLINSLTSLDQKYRDSLTNCQKTNAISNHKVFGYISSQYGFKNTSITGLSPDEEPSPQKLAEIVDFVKKNNLKYILTEPLDSPKFAETISTETGLEVITFNPIEGLTPEQLNNGEDYFSIQSQNIINLAKALECQPQ